MKKLLAMGLVLLATGGGGCGDSKDGDGGARDALPPLTRDFGDTAYELVTADTAIEEVTSVLLYSDGVEARVVLLRGRQLERSGSARLEAEVRDAATLEVVAGRVNLDADSSFANNDLVPASGFVLASEREVRGTGIEVGTLVTVDYDFRAVLARSLPLEQVDELFFD